MSVKVDLDQLSGALNDFAMAYLITVGDDFHAHTVAVDPVFAGGVFDLIAVGKTTRTNVARHGDVTLLWPPREPGGYTLIVDGRGDVGGEPLRITPSRAVLHRAAKPDSPTTSGCGDDCVPLA
jgi:hypothetical protein